MKKEKLSRVNDQMLPSPDPRGIVLSVKRMDN